MIQQFPEVWERVSSAYKAEDSHGKKLARVNNTSPEAREKDIEQFPIHHRADHRHISFTGFNRYLESVLKSLSKDEHARILDRAYKPKSGLPSFQDVNVLGSLVEAHPLAKHITNQRPLLPEDYLSLVRSGFADLAILKKAGDKKVTTGVLDASCGPSHGDYVWTRDMAAVGLGKLDIKQFGFAEKIASKLYEAYASPSQRNRINGLLGNIALWDTDKPNKDIPNTKFSVEEVKEGNETVDYELVDCKQEWGMQQLDAYGYFLQLVSKLAAEDKLNIAELDDKLAAKISETDSEFFKDGNNQESTLVALARMLVKIEYWNRNDFGAWEFPMHHQRASSIAACISGLKSVYNLFEKKGYFDNPDACLIKVRNKFGEDIQQFKAELEHGIKEGERVLFEKRIPDKDEAKHIDSKAIELQEGGETHDREHLQHINREKDAALLFALVLADPSLIGEGGLSEAQEEAILRTVYELMGEVGFQRFPEDEYMGKNWVTDKHPNTGHGEHADNAQNNYRPAEWSFFDPYLAVYFYKKFEKNPDDLESFLRADRHARRALAQITKANYEIERPGHNSEGKSGEKVMIKIPAGEVMEHYWYNTKDMKTGKDLPNGEGYWMPGENYRLNWTKIALQQMIYHGSKAGEIFKTEYPNGWSHADIVGLNLTAQGRHSRERSTGMAA